MNEILAYIIILHLAISCFISGYTWLSLKDIKLFFRIVICILVVLFGVELFIVDCVMNLYNRINRKK